MFRKTCRKGSFGFQQPVLLKKCLIHEKKNTCCLNSPRNPFAKRIEKPVTEYLNLTAHKNVDCRITLSLLGLHLVLNKTHWLHFKYVSAVVCFLLQGCVQKGESHEKFLNLKPFNPQRQYFPDI